MSKNYDGICMRCSNHLMCSLRVVVCPLIGSVPSMYREFYETVCASSDDQFERDLFVRILSASGLSHDVLAQVWLSSVSS